MTPELTPPEPAKQLYQDLFENTTVGDLARVMAEGMQALVANIDRLLSDIELLVEAKRFASASFLLATADEELAKVFILLDACRLDPAKHFSVLVRLCCAFYNHIQKHAYNEVRRHPNVYSMKQALVVWRIETKRWWPGSSNPEDAEPSLPHDTVFDREMALYTDWDYTTGNWWVPDQATNAEKFEDGLSPSDWARLQSELQQLKEASDTGLLRPEPLATLNTVFARTYVSDSTPNPVIARLQSDLVDSLAKQLRLPKEEIEKSVFM